MIMIFKLRLDHQSHRYVVFFSELFIMILNICFNILNLIKLFWVLFGVFFNLHRKFKRFMINHRLRVQTDSLGSFFMPLLIKKLILFSWSTLRHCELRFIIGLKTLKVFISKHYFVVLFMIIKSVLKIRSFIISIHNCAVWILFEII